MSSRWVSGTDPSGVTLSCAWHRGCPGFYGGSSYTNTRGARKEARALGWLVDQDGGRHIGGGRTQRLDYCPEHADRERARRGLRVVGDRTAS